MSANGSETAHEDVAAQGGTATALASFKDWSNYLLVTTVAAAGWVGSGKVTFSDDLYQSLALWCLGTSIVFGIFTLALIPLLAEQIGDESSIYLVPVEFHAVNVTMRMYLTQVCRPQHITFIAGIAFYCVGVSRQLGPVVWVLAAAALLCIFSRPFARLGR